MEEQEQVSEAGALAWRHHGDGKHSWSQVDGPCLHPRQVSLPIRRVLQDPFPGFPHPLRWQAGILSVRLLVRKLKVFLALL